MSLSARYTITRVDGYATIAPADDGDDVPPGASFHVTDTRNGAIVAVYRSEETPRALPHGTRLAIAENRARSRAHELECGAVVELDG